MAKESNIESEAIEYAKRHYNMHPDEKFDSILDVVKAAAKSMNGRAWERFTGSLGLELMTKFNCTFGGSINPIVIGKYTISLEPNEPNRINIVTEGGEGGGFDIDSFEQVVKEFYSKNF